MYVTSPETLHMPRLIMVFTSFNAVILPLEKKWWSGAERRLYQSGGDVYIIRVESSEEL